MTTATATTNDLVVGHVPLVAHIVRETLGRVPGHVSGDDLHSAGLVALVTASRAFDPSRGTPFANYAATRVRGAMLDELRSLDWASRAVRRRGREIDATRAALATDRRQAPDDAEVAESLGLSLAEVQRSEDDLARASVLSLDSEAAVRLSDVLPASDPSPEAQVEHGERLEYLDHAIAALPARLRAVVRGCFIDERTMSDLAEELGVTESRISQMRAEALALLRDGLNSALDPELLDRRRRRDGCAARRREAYCRAVAGRHGAR
ncbi:sigma-70 family RNA polymerase sigma factor [Nocardioides halotolerans]|uniref:sigma-70 family RNA polymerase sigma factor n=1 Tax=Nocardioides halotolerans TaxID=433660 RepID=UPI000419FDAD|nr:sigma-70 family RNA polymerase sigma factor [Nocardioides halotolerans]